MANDTPLNKNEFLDRMREALGTKTSGVPSPPEVDPALVRLASDSDDLPALFADRAKGVGMEIYPTNIAELPAALTALLSQLKARCVTLAIDNVPGAEQVQAALQEAGIEQAAWQGDREMKSHYEVDAGITDVHAALAETGTLVCLSSDRQGRGLSLVPAKHVAIVLHSQILPDMLDYMATNRDIAPADLPSAQAFITGPSKTADIEGILITGVHGPESVHILLVDDSGLQA